MGAAPWSERITETTGVGASQPSSLAGRLVDHGRAAPVDHDRDGEIDRTGHAVGNSVDHVLLGVPAPHGIVSTVMFAAGSLALLEIGRAHV